MKKSLLFPLFVIALFIGNITFGQSITITSPNGGELVSACSDYTITWTESGTSNYYNIEYSVDNGANWVTVASSYNTLSNSFTWQPPNLSTNNTLIRVTDSQNLPVTDMADALFTINAALTITDPNGGETFATGDNTVISYLYLAGIVNTVQAQYSIDNGTSWTTISSGNTADGSVNWTIPNTPSTNVKVKITDLSNSSCKTDTSDVVCTILSDVIVTAPNGGEIYQATVKEQNIPNAIVQASNATLEINTVNYTGNATSYTQTFVPDNPLNKLRIQFSQIPGSYVRVYDGPSTSYPLLGTFYSTGTAISTHYTGAITVLNSGAFDAFITSVGTPTQNITWDITGTSQYFDIDYSTDGGTSWKRIVNDYRQTTSTGNYDWQVPNVPTTQGLIRISDANNGSIIDQSDATFTINAADPVFVMYTPNGGEQFYPTTSPTVKWLSAFTGPNVKLEYSIDNGTTWTLIEATYPDQFGGLVSTEGIYSWTVPNTPTTDALFRVSDAANPTALDSS
ncbi:MAG: hypothetical protein HRT58_05380, partial [Crocinitomicaceae bacterium]|nr:hypothetical protein [Flavobacteriales bacterium]NQZ35071.1 hypothetical protein [Crocinitomicaceae bacterium]